MKIINVTKNALLITTILLSSNAVADVKPASLFTDNMILQQQTDAPIWGWADAGEKITVTASWGEIKNTTTNEKGEWLITLPTPKATENSEQSYSLTFDANNQIIVNNVLVGEVWLASGQSNMGYTIGMLELSEQQIGDSDQPMIREYTVDQNASGTPVDDTKGNWIVASKNTIGNFSGTAYFFARNIQKTINVPVGIINSSWGGTSIEGWLSKDTQKSHHVTQSLIAKIDKWERDFDVDKNQIPFNESHEKWRKYKQVTEQLNLEFNQDEPQLIERKYKPHYYPGNLYNGMINPLIPYALKGIIWYQGEFNASLADNAYFYQKQLTDLILSWRNDWKNAELPFYAVQLANFHAPQLNPVEHKQYWPINREAMRKSIGNLDNAGMALTIDIGDAENIHPQNKMELGRRLALLALHNDYEQKVEPSGPLYKSFKIEGNAILIEFDHIGSGLMAKGGTGIHGFAIAGKDGDYVWADAKIITRAQDAKQLIKVSNKLIPEPKSVR
ncbi:MAG: hypothetical protein HOH19_03790 [Kordiimonadaceae bacterium]|jgi:sialate O-acetylesterase|nr:hypothetical protein [Kordiimonadaceae bacterium]MBT6031674.1 hypothetical protein [Kordiimonadaceae bacterium]